MDRRLGNTNELDVIFALAGNDRGRAGRLRIWSALALVAAAVLATAGGFGVWGGSPTTVAAARIESGFRPRLFVRYALKPDSRIPYRVTGHLADADSVVFIRQGVPWRCAPLVSGRAGANRPPRVYYAASEQNYRRARAEDRFAGDLDSASATSHAAEVATCGAPADGYLLFDDGSSRAWRESGRSFLIFAAVIGSIALIGFLTALRMRSPRA